MARNAKTILILIGTAIASSAGVGAWMLVHPKPRGAVQYVEARIDDVGLIYTPDYARFPPGQSGGRISALEIAATFPDLKAAGGVIRSFTPDDKLKPEAPIIFLSLGPMDPNVAPVDRVNTLYARFLEAEVNETTEGLIMRRFIPASPYQGEDLYFAPPEGRTFAARCTHPATPNDSLPETCIASFRMANLDVDLRFPRALLPQWERLAEGAKALTQSMLIR